MIIIIDKVFIKIDKLFKHFYLLNINIFNIIYIALSCFYLQCQSNYHYFIFIRKVVNTINFTYLSREDI
jgi:hypothetical protein